MKILKLKTRFAPSPTGFLHLGNIRTALFNALLAKRNDGCFLLRIEDTDFDRSRPEYIAALLEDLRWLGLNWVEGIGVGGSHQPYLQSERESVYARYYRVLEAMQLVYTCFCTAEELVLSRRAQLAAGRPPRYTGTCARMSSAERQERLNSGLQPTLRFCVPIGQIIEFKDLVRGLQRFCSDDIGDFVIRRADGTPQFLFANAVDDNLMEVTHVLRGEDHLANTPRQLLLLEALGLSVPNYGHLPLIVGTNGEPLSKRLGDLSVRKLRAVGYFSEALLNYLARLGHSYGSDLWMDWNELAAGFSQERLGHAPAHYDEIQLLHWQAEAIRHASIERLWCWMGPKVWELVPTKLAEEFVITVRSNIRFPVDALFWAERLFSTKMIRSAESQDAINTAGHEFFGEALAAYNQNGANYQTLICELQRRTGAKGKNLFMPLRAAFTGETHGPELARILTILHHTETVRCRLLSCI